MSPHPGTLTTMSAGARWGVLVVASVAALVFAVVVSFLGLLYRADFASGGRSPGVAAVFWGLAAAVVASPVALLHRMGFRVRPATAASWALGVAAVWFVVGYFVLA